MRPLVVIALLAINAVSVALLIIAGYFADGKFGNDPCEMSFMYPLFMENWPSLSRVNGQCEKTRYRVLRYFEQRIATDFKQPKGYPVLFVPGHLGSFKQARSLGSQVGSNVNVYAIDFLEQPAALSGSLLRRQAEFVNEAAYAISKLHGGKPVVIVGHSMGAVAAWGSQHLPMKHPVQVSTFFSICAPLARPILLSEKVMSDFYSDFELKNANASSNLVLVSLSCGRRDALVPSNLCVATKLMNDSSKVFHCPVSELSGFSVNHQAVLWCRQVSLKVAAAVTLAASLTDVDAAKRRKEIAKSFLGDEKADEDKFDELREKMTSSESPLKALTKASKASWPEKILNVLVMAVRSNWTRVFAFGFSCVCWLLVVSLRDIETEMQTDAESFVDDFIAERQTKRRSPWSLLDETTALSLYRQLAAGMDLSGPTMPVFLALFIGQSMNDEGAWFLNAWLLFASHGCIQVVMVLVLSLRRALKSVLPRPTRFRLLVMSGLYVLTIFILFGVFGWKGGILSSADVLHLALCCVFVATFAASYILTLWITLTWGREDNSTKTRGSRAEIRAIVAFALMHILSICDSLGCFLLVWDALMLTSPLFKHEQEAMVVSPPTNPSPPCRSRLDIEEIELVATNLFLMLPAIVFLLRIVYLDAQPRFHHLKGAWGDYDFERRTGTNHNLDMNELATRNGSMNGETPSKKRSTSSKAAIVEVELIPVKLPNGHDDHIERMVDLEYDEKEPSVLIEVGADVVQVDTLRPGEDVSKADGAETIHIGKDVHLQERRRRWTRTYKSEVVPGRVLSRFPLGAVLPFGCGLFFAVQNQQLVWIFPSAALLFVGFTVSSMFYNRRAVLENDIFIVERIQRGG